MFSIGKLPVSASLIDEEPRPIWHFRINLQTKTSELTEVTMLMVEHLQKSSPLIAQEIQRWKYLLWDDYIEYQREQELRKKLVIP